MTKFRLAVLALAVSPGVLIAAPATNWISRVALSPIGGHVLGNPAAPTKLVEYVSYTCSHCAYFVGEASAPLKANYVKGGKVSVEVRNAVRDKYDLTAALLARCGGTARFFGNHEALFANQEAWMTQLQAYDRGAAKPSEQVAALRDIGRNTGLYTLMGKRGFTPAQLDACIANPGAMKQILAMTDEAWNKIKIGGTPAFTVNGAIAGGSSWATLRDALPAVAQ
ncbi:Protein-disulfide isomerase [Sphingobium herbicidovorans NBRC 16415]|uniref:Protein-disulfide isomerase n=1 Tax=Sphingobium herbicidovorans (strain ATCC 700291 / DSM 11019 / CCUG 56400 / KCTC 2939 / LMG 18315 / NBRC 16415 / MH) TaxID=1219045 RepID=A0A086P944_SPHHM|nr:thioredoxin domain-containing protein [Sphingobium herbicidovorans]KFG89912.1 Protein-disulfide isomerase [Sphingobium herbicidovorans NBRC 16415]